MVRCDDIVILMWCDAVWYDDCDVTRCDAMCCDVMCGRRKKYITAGYGSRKSAPHRKCQFSRPSQLRSLIRIVHYLCHLELNKTQSLVHGDFWENRSFHTAMFVYICGEMTQNWSQTSRKKVLNLDTPHTFWLVQWVDNILVSTLQKRILKQTIKKCTFFRFHRFFFMHQV